jgi:hypothetical protein
VKLTLTTLLLVASAQCAFAKEPECRAIEDTAARLMCYDAAYPRKSAKPATDRDDVARAAYKDPYSAEEARTSAKLKNICRGC